MIATEHRIEDGDELIDDHVKRLSRLRGAADRHLKEYKTKLFGTHKILRYKYSGLQVITVRFDPDELRLYAGVVMPIMWAASGWCDG